MTRLDAVSYQGWVAVISGGSVVWYAPIPGEVLAALWLPLASAAAVVGGGVALLIHYYLAADADDARTARQERDQARQERDEARRQRGEAQRAAGAAEQRATAADERATAAERQRDGARREAAERRDHARAVEAEAMAAMEAVEAERDRWKLSAHNASQTLARLRRRHGLPVERRRPQAEAEKNTNPPTANLFQL